MGRTILDFETMPIEPRPDYPPRPVGVALRSRGRTRYWAWGHRSENNCTWNQGRRVLADVWRSGDLIVMHNAEFDLDVAETHFGLPWPARWRCTLIRSFLHDPNQRQLGLKALSQQWLGEKPTERDALLEWLRAHRREFPELKGVVLKESNAPTWTYLTPGATVGAAYAGEDVLRTDQLDRYLDGHEIVGPGAYQEAEERLQRATRMFIEMAREGIPIAARRLRQALPLWEKTLGRLDRRLRRDLGVRDLDFGKADEVADALESAGLVTPEAWPRTKTGKRQTSVKAWPDLLEDPWLDPFLYRAKLRTSIQNFARPWLAQVRGGRLGRLATSWNVTRKETGGGARTGRPSSRPNLQNVPKRRPQVTASQRRAHYLRQHGTDAYWLPFARPVGDWQLPDPRDFIKAERGHVLIDADYRQQELRILAHFTKGELLEQYLADAHFDLHGWTQDLVEEQTGRLHPRGRIKIVRFANIYGQSIKGCAKQLRIDYADARDLVHDLESTTPGVEKLRSELFEMAEAGEPFFTWGGRPNYCEDPIEHEHWTQTFEYKMLNTIVQGSAADQIIEAMLCYHENPRREGRLLVTVHDQLVVMSPARARREEMRRLASAMAEPKFNLPMPVDMRWSSSTWARLRE